MLLYLVYFQITAEILIIWQVFRCFCSSFWLHNTVRWHNSIRWLDPLRCALLKVDKRVKFCLVPKIRACLFSGDYLILIGILIQSAWNFRHHCFREIGSKKYLSLKIKDFKVHGPHLMVRLYKSALNVGNFLLNCLLI